MFLLKYKVRRDQDCILRFWKKKRNKTRGNRRPDLQELHWQETTQSWWIFYNKVQFCIKKITFYAQIKTFFLLFCKKWRDGRKTCVNYPNVRRKSQQRTGEYAGLPLKTHINSDTGTGTRELVLKKKETFWFVMALGGESKLQFMLRPSLKKNWISFTSLTEEEKQLDFHLLKWEL